MGQKSSIDRLPQALREKLLAMLQNPACTQAEIVDAINEDAGEPLISKSSLNRYAQRMRRFAEKNRQAKEVADAYIEKYGEDNRNKIGKVVNEQIRLAVFDLIGKIEDAEGEGDLAVNELSDVLYKLSRGLRELESAEKLNAERTEHIRRDTLKEACEVVERETKTSGLTAETIETIKNKILGI